jgi:spermidine synthase
MIALADRLPSRIRLGLWLVTPLITGAAIMVLELTAFRLYAPYFGYSIYVWAIMISVVMAALAAGYAIGGWVADCSRTDLPLYTIILLSDVYQMAIIHIVGSLLAELAQQGDLSGTLMATLIIFAPPMGALATVAPFITRLLARAGHVGSTAGNVYALATVGGIAGILATSFFLVPRLGTRATLLTVCATCAVVGVAGITARRREALFAFAPVAMLAFTPETTWPSGTVWVSESAYNLVRVVRSGSRLLLLLNDERSAHTIRDESSGWTGHYYDYFALGPLLVPARRLLVLGMGAGGSIASTRATAPDIEIDAVEIDEKVVEAGMRLFGLQPDQKRLRMHVADARPWLARDREHYEIIHIDLYQGGPYVPFYLVTVEFFQMVRAHMADDGLMMMNVFDVSNNRELLNSTAATLRRIFPTVMVLSVGSGNHLVFAFAGQRGADSVCSQLTNAKGSEAVMRLARKTASEMSDLAPSVLTPVFTDDHAPVEEITRRMLAEFRGRTL